MDSTTCKLDLEKGWGWGGGLMFINKKYLLHGPMTLKKKKIFEREIKKNMEI